ncbi:hypothetical protein ACFLYO_11440, partial [Chloroflexota bacterium]
MTNSDHSIVAIEQLQDEGQFRKFLRRFTRSRNVVVGSAVMSVVIMLVLFGPLLTSYGPTEQMRRERLEPPSATHLLGT